MSADFGDYRIIEPLGQGGTAEVFAAVQKSTGRLCALKRLTPEAQMHPTAPIRLRREAQIAAQLDHPNITRMWDAEEIEGRFYIASELVMGVEVAQLIDSLRSRRRAVTPPLAAAVLLPVLEGLTYAHRAMGRDGMGLNLVHRDLSSKNVMIERTGDIKIIDFGVAYAQVDEFRTAPGVIVGSLGYLSPEQARSQPVDHRSDLYSAGVLLYEILTGRPVIQKARTARAVLEEVIQLTPPPPSAKNPMVGPSLDKVVALALEKSPERRFQSADDFARAVRRAVGPAAPPEVLQDLVRSSFPEILERVLRLEAAAHTVIQELGHAAPEVATDKEGSDELGWDDPRFFTVTSIPQSEATEIVEPSETTKTRPMLPRPSGHVPAMPHEPTRQYASPPLMGPTVVRPPKPRRTQVLFLILVAAFLSGGLAAVFLVEPSPKSSPPPMNATKTALSKNAPTAAPRAVVEAVMAPASVVSSEAPSPPRRRRVKRVAAPPRPEPSAPDPVTVRLQNLGRQLSGIQKKNASGADVDVEAIERILEDLWRMAKTQKYKRAVSRIRIAQDCLTTCGTEKDWLEASQRAFAAMDKAHRAATP